jgi:hypothetical protein
MLYPLSYEGARGQSSDQGSARGGREWPAPTHLPRAHVDPAQAHTHSTPAQVDAGPG